MLVQAFSSRTIISEEIGVGGSCFISLFIRRFVSFSFLSVIALSTLLVALLVVSLVSWFCDHRACISINRRKNRHGHWLCWMSTGRKTGCAGCRRVERLVVLDVDG